MQQTGLVHGGKGVSGVQVVVHRVSSTSADLDRFAAALIVALDRLTHWATHRTSGFFALGVVRQDIARRHTMRHLALLVLAAHDVLPQALHVPAVGGYGARAVFMWTF